MGRLGARSRAGIGTGMADKVLTPTEVKLDRGVQRRTNMLARGVGWALRLGGHRGSILVEFAVTVPVLMAALTGTCSIAMAFYSLQQVSNACASAVQGVATNEGYANDDDPCALARTTITGMLPNWTAANFGYQISITDSGGTAHYFPTTQGALAYGSAFTCTGDSQYLAPNEPVALTVSYRYAWVPVLSIDSSKLPPLTTTQGTSVE